jgi:hypothetical protein
MNMPLTTSFRAPFVIVTGPGTHTSHGHRNKSGERPHDEPDIDVVLQELDVRGSADHGVEAPPLCRQVEVNTSPFLEVSDDAPGQRSILAE